MSDPIYSSRRKGLNKERTGEVHGFWTVFGPPTKVANALAYQCRCVCGFEKVVIFRTLENGRSKSCGCNAIELRVEKLRKHGKAGDPTYKSWHAMLQRVQGKGGHESYVQRGITVCDDWLEFGSFFADMGERPTGKTLDRIDNTKGYYKGNCRWATYKEQSANRSSGNRMVMLDGREMNFSDACKAHKIHEATVRGRMRRGIPIFEALTKITQGKST